MIALRHSLPVMVDGIYELLFLEDPQIYAYTRTLGEEQLVIVLNFAKEETAIPSEIAEKIEGAEIVIGNYEAAPDSVLRAYEAVVYRTCGSK